MANPRKFSEKIALHNHRQAEETAAFEKIMKEVLDVKPNEEPLQTRVGGMSPRQSRTRSPVGPIRSTRERKLSPYSSGPYLSPPSDTGWRRASSDSDLHQSGMQGMGMDRIDSANRVSWSTLSSINVPDRNPNGRPRSSCDVPRVPGIHIYPTMHDPGAVQIPIGNNTGSLPDLTNVDFSSPLHMPLDQDQDGSPYSSSPINTSPLTLSPTSVLPGMRHQGRFNFTPPVSHPNHLSVPSNSRYHHPNIAQSVPVDKNIGVVENSDYSPLSGAMYQQPCSPTSTSPTLQQLQTDGYRSPRPSPQSSPGMSGRHSAPCSPGAPSPISSDYHLPHQNMQFQQHFEKLTVSDSPVGTIAYVEQPVMSPQMAQSHSPNLPEVPSDGGYYSKSPSHQLAYPSTSPSLQNTTPNTPTSLPEITLTDFSAGQDFSRQFENDFFTDEQLKDSLGSIDSSEFPMLNNPEMTLPEILDDYRS